MARVADHLSVAELPARASGISRTASPGRCSRKPSRSSRVKRVRDPAASSFWCSTTPAGTARRTSPCPKASGWSTCPPPDQVRGRLYTPELQPAETLWTLVDEPIVNKHFETLAELDATVAERCVALDKDRDLVKGPAGFHWWPERAYPI